MDPGLAISRKQALMISHLCREQCLGLVSLARIRPHRAASSPRHRGTRKTAIPPHFSFEELATPCEQKVEASQKRQICELMPQI